MKRFLLPLLSSPLLLMLACGGSDPKPAPPPAPLTMAYTDPAPEGFRLVRDPAKSTASRLVLNLLAPDGSKGLGFALSLGYPSEKLVAAKVDPMEPDLVQNIAYRLEGAQDAMLRQSKVDTQQGVLQVAIFQKGTSNPAVYGGGVLYRIALELKPGATAGDLPLRVLKARHLDANGTPVDLDNWVGIGTATLK